jgi:hypothetical protein
MLVDNKKYQVDLKKIAVELIAILLFGSALSAKTLAISFLLSPLFNFFLCS